MRKKIFVLLFCILLLTVMYPVSIAGNELSNDDWFYYPTYNNYAPSGMPDFDQRQDNWKNPRFGFWSFCGPTSVANIMWYFDSMHSDESGSPGDGLDLYPLVKDYEAPGTPNPGPRSDDHNINNVNDLQTEWDPENSVYGNEFIEMVAWYTDNDGCNSGSNHVGSTPDGIYNGFIKWIEDNYLFGFYDIIEYDPRNQDAFEEITDFIIGGSGVLLNLGFYTQSGSYNGNHWVTIAGISFSELQIALSDPYVDKSNPTSDYTLHNDANIVSHDIYNVGVDCPFPQYSSWWLEDYIPDYAQDSLTVIKNVLIISRNTNTAKPEKPIITGPSSGKTNEELTYMASSIDPDGDQLFYLFDWGDGHSSFWYGPYDSGDECNASNIWFDQGTYEIKVKTQDSHGAESEWSDPFEITMPKNKDIISSFIVTILNYILYRYPILNNLLMNGEV